ncbi:hypothetical protein Pla110_22440 [Polystyrenella longa]|uniref:Uncharacterized protein n=1 Tax=Polystyrenella longa TaxID=2528007 RepID=A0A518CMT6_9PLAN|nr:hypothetical protein [Polystyrenella longa]QDU80514.1 hypothetical protein Pla110_22440 [Polystyrenella longa]
MTNVSELKKRESIITDGSTGFFAMCAAFSEIQELELWKPKYKSFPKYCRDRWSMDAGTVSHYIKAASVIVDLDHFESRPTNEGQCRVLGKLLTEERRAVWEKVLESDEKATGRHIKEIATRMGFIDLPKREPAPPQEMPFIEAMVYTTEAIRYLSSRINSLASEEHEKIGKYVLECRSLLDQIDHQLSTLEVVA